MAGKKYNLENNPLFTPAQEEAIKEAERQQPGGRGRPKSDNLIREGAQAGLTEEFTRATFILSVKLLDDVKNYAYTERLKMKDAVEKLLRQGIEAYKKNGGELLDRNRGANDD